MVSGESKNRPRKTPWRGKSCGNSLQVVDGALHNGFLRSIAQRQQRDRRIISVRCKGGPIDNAVTGIPYSARAGTIEQHLDPTLNTERDWFQTAARAGKLAEGENCECGRNNPAHRIRKPWPAILVWVETNVAIGGTKLPFPGPIRFFPCAANEPLDSLQPGRYCRQPISKSDCGQRSDPSAILVISCECGPAAIRILCAQKKRQRAFDVTHTRRAECERGVARCLNGWLRRRGKSSPASTRELA